MQNTAILAALLAIAVFLFRRLKIMERTIMSAISEYAAKQATFNAEVAADLSSVAENIKALNDKLTELQNSAGTVTPEDQALLDDALAKSGALVTQADALAGKEPPAPPADPNA